MPATASEVHALLREQQNRVILLLGRGSLAVRELRTLYSEAIDSLQGQLARRAGAGLGDTYTAHMHRVFLMQLRQGVSTMAAQLGGQFALRSDELQVESATDLIKNVKRLEQLYTDAMPILPIEEAARLRGVIDGVAPSLLRSQQTSFARWGARLVGQAESSLGLSFATGETNVQAMRRVESTMATSWWEAERIVRTESNHA